MSDTLEPSQTASETKPTPEKPSALNEYDLALVAERLALIQGHLSKLTSQVVSGVCIMQGFLVIAVKITGHTVSQEPVSGAWLIDGKDVTEWLGVSKDEENATEWQKKYLNPPSP
jgi:hypothetical protein